MAGTPTSWRVVGLAEEMFVGTGAYVTAASGRPSQGNVLRIVTEGHAEPIRTAVANALEQALTDASVQVQSSASVSRAEGRGTGHMLPLITSFLAVVVAMGVVGCVGLASTMSTNVMERAREFGVLHAIGALPKAVRRMVTAEASSPPWPATW